MPDAIANYVQASDNANEYANVLLEAIEPKALEDIDNLMHELGDRDEDLWNEIEVDAEQTVSDYEEVPANERGLEWVIGLAAVSAAATLQFFLDERDDLIIKPSAYRVQKMSPFNLTTEQLVQAGKRKAVFVPLETYETLQAKYVQEFAFLKQVDNSVLYNTLVEANSLKPIDKQIADATGYVSRMTNYPSGSPQFKEAVADLVSTQSKSGLMGMNRRSVEGISQFRKIGGDLQTLMVWILDPNSKHCSYCPARAGEVMTYEEWVADGLPGEDVCRGGSKCNCHLEVTE